MSDPLILRVLGHVATVFALVAGVAVAVLSLLIGFDMFARGLLGFSVQGTDELGGYVLALVGSLGLSYTLIHRGHPRIDVALRFVPAKGRAVLHAIAYASLTAFAVFMAVHAAGELAISLRFQAVANTPLQTPMWIPQGLWVAGTVFFAVTAAALTVHCIVLIFRGGNAADRQYGTLTAADEVREYTGDAAPGKTGG